LVFFKHDERKLVLENLFIIDYFTSDGNCSEDAASDGGEFLDDNIEFRRPSPEILLKSIPIVQSHQVGVCSDKALSRRVFLCKSGPPL
jgi:hypothetical protein